MALLFFCTTAVQAADSGSALVTLKVGKFAGLQVLTTSYVVQPSADDMAAGEKEVSRALQVKVRTNSGNGATLKVYGEALAGGLSLADFFIRRNGSGSDFLAVGDSLAAAASIWQANAPVSGWQIVDLDIKIANLWNYTATTEGQEYSLTLVFTVTTN